MKKPLTPRRSEDNLTIEYDPEDFEKSLPNLAKELLEKDSPGRIPLNKDMLQGAEEEENNPSDLAPEHGIHLDDYSDSMESDENPDIHDHDENTENAPVNPQKVLFDKVRAREEYIQAQGDKLEDRELYNPNAEDFIRRCHNKADALEIIAYLEKRGELSGQQAIEYRTKLEKEGLQGFGQKKTWGYYERKYRKAKFHEDLNSDRPQSFNSESKENEKE